MNTYRYVHQNPLRYIDPTGEIAIVDDALIIAGAAAIAAGAACYASNCGQAIVDAIGGMFAAPGNVADTQVSQDYGEAASDARQCGGEPPDKCKWLEENKHRYRADQFKRIQKAWDCRRSRRR